MVPGARTAETGPAGPDSAGRAIGLRARAGPRRCARAGRWRRSGSAATAWLRSRRDGSGAANHDASRSDCRRGNHSNPKAASSRPTGYGPMASGRRWTADSMDGLPKPSHVEGRTTTSQARVGVGDGEPGPSRRGTEHDRAAGLGQEAVELGAVAVLGRAEEPVGGAELGGQAQAAGDVLAGEGPGRLQDQDAAPGRRPRASRTPIAARRPGSRPDRGRRCCRRWWRRCPGRPAGAGSGR